MLCNRNCSSRRRKCTKQQVKNEAQLAIKNPKMMEICRDKEERDGEERDEEKREEERGIKCNEDRKGKLKDKIIKSDSDKLICVNKPIFSI